MNEAEHVVCYPTAKQPRWRRRTFSWWWQFRPLILGVRLWTHHLKVWAWQVDIVRADIGPAKFRVHTVLLWSRTPELIIKNYTAEPL